MPTYAYRCDAGHEFDELQGIREEPLHTCPIKSVAVGDPDPCGAVVKRVPCTVNFRFAGKAPTPKFHERG